MTTTDELRDLIDQLGDAHDEDDLRQRVQRLLDLLATVLQRDPLGLIAPRAGRTASESATEYGRWAHSSKRPSVARESSVETPSITVERIGDGLLFRVRREDPERERQTDHSQWEAIRVLAAAIAREFPEQVLPMAAFIAAQDERLRGQFDRVNALINIEACRAGVQEELVRALIPAMAVDEMTADMLKRASDAAQAESLIWRQPMFSSSEAAAMLGAKPSNREKLSRLRKKSRILGLPRGERGFVYPQFQFDAFKHALYPEVPVVNKLLDAKDDPWGVASWWISTNDILACRPFELLGTDRSPEIERAAKALLDP